MTSRSDFKLWRLAAGGDANAFGEIYERHDLAVQAYCLWRTGDHAFSGDATSIVFLEAWRQRADTALTTSTARPLGVQPRLAGKVQQTAPEAVWSGRGGVCAPASGCGWVA